MKDTPKIRKNQIFYAHVSYEWNFNIVVASSYNQNLEQERFLSGSLRFEVKDKHKPRSTEVYLIFQLLFILS